MIADISIIPSLSKFRTFFNKPCFNHFVRYIHGLVVSDKKTINSINKDFIEQSALPEKTGISKSNVSRALDLLESRGLVEKRRRGMTNTILLK